MGSDSLGPKCRDTGQEHRPGTVPCGRGTAGLPVPQVLHCCQHLAPHTHTPTPLCHKSEAGGTERLHSPQQTPARKASLPATSCRDSPKKSRVRNPLDSCQGGQLCPGDEATAELSQETSMRLHNTQREKAPLSQILSKLKQESSSTKGGYVSYFLLEDCAHHTISLCTAGLWMHLSSYEKLFLPVRKRPLLPRKMPLYFCCNRNLSLAVTSTLGGIPDN